MVLLLAALLACQEGENYAHLKRLEWIVGSWAGAGEMPGYGSYEDEFVLEWTPDKNFIKNTYVMKVGGKPVWTDTGLIGWDAEKKQIVGINFGMDGTIGWGREQKSEQDTLVVEGRTAGPVVKEEFRATMKKVSDDEMTVLTEFKKGDKYEPMAAPTKYKRKKLTLTAVPDDERSRINFQHLKGLEFLAGTWQGKGEGAQGLFEISYKFEWAMNRNFLVCAVTAQALGQVVYAATEWIGWDVDRKNVVSIAFVRDGRIVVTVGTVKEKEAVFENEGGRRTLRRAEGRLSVTIERREEGRWIADKKIEATQQP